MLALPQYCTSALLYTALLALLACSRSGSQEAPASSQSADSEKAAEDPWERHIARLRDDKNRTFRTSATSPMAGTQFLKSAPSTSVYLAHDGGERFELTGARTPASVASFSRTDETWSWHAEDNRISAARAGQPLASGAVLGDGVTLSMARFSISIYLDAQTLTFKTFDPHRAEFKSFQHLEYYPPDRRFAVAATFEKVERLDEVIMLTSQNLQKTFHRYATVHFQIEGQDQVLTAFKYALSGDGSDMLFVPYKDTTSGGETYGAGRYLEFQEPTKPQFTLDFNESYNPLCNYSKAYNCPIPPHENRLKVAILAGEKTYPH